VNRLANLSNYLENKVLDHVLGTIAYAKPTVYLALFTTDPTEVGTGTEVSGGAYARQTIAFNAAATGSATNSADVLFPTATASWGTITHVGLYDAATAGNMLWHGALSAGKAIGTDDQFKLGAGRLTVSMD
jgi:hypothetical protein